MTLERLTKQWVNLVASSSLETLAFWLCRARYWVRKKPMFV